jgi:aryl-alcohol dehydrogenase (NADP+)
MLHRKLGNTGTSVGKIALGTMYFGSETPEGDAFSILDTFIEAGGNLVDTANVYVNGVSEEIIGRWIAVRPKDITDQVVLATKGRFNANQEVNSAGLTRRWLRRSLDASLTRLRAETIDLYQLHASDMHTPVEETLSFLDDAVKAGKIHYIWSVEFRGLATAAHRVDRQGYGRPSSSAATTSIQPAFSRDRVGSDSRRTS